MQKCAAAMSGVPRIRYMKLFTTEEIRAIDRATIEREEVSPLELIERVGEGVASEIATRWRPNKPTIVFAGPGTTAPTPLRHRGCFGSAASAPRSTFSTSVATNCRATAPPRATACCARCPN